MVISSITNAKVKYVKKLRSNKFMEEEKEFIVEGEHLVLEAKASGLLLEVIKLESDEEDYGVLSTLVTKNVMRSLSNLPSFPKVIGVCKYDDAEKVLGNKIMILDGVQDPGNVGTIIRSAKAFGFTSIVLSKDSVKKYNDKVIRATQGMIFKLNVITKDLLEFIPELKNKGYKVYATNVNDGKTLDTISKDGKIAIIMGNEGSGVKDEIASLSDQNIYIKMDSSCESLNVSVAASIIMYEFSKEN